MSNIENKIPDWAKLQLQAEVGRFNSKVIELLYKQLPPEVAKELSVKIGIIHEEFRAKYKL